MATDVVSGTADLEKEAPFDPDRLAYSEVAGWRAYYDRKWLRMLRLLVQMERVQFGFSWMRALQGAYYVVRASAAWVPLDHDVRAIRRYLRKFYSLVKLHGGKNGKRYHFDPNTVAELELRYWYYNRKVGTLPYSEDSPLIPSLAELHAATFGLPVATTHESAVGRALSLHTVGKITGGKSSDLEGDWRRAEEYLREGYRSLVKEL